MCSSHRLRKANTSARLFCPGVLGGGHLRLPEALSMDRETFRVPTLGRFKEALIAVSYPPRRGTLIRLRTFNRGSHPAGARRRQLLCRLCCVLCGRIEEQQPTTMKIKVAEAQSHLQPPLRHPWRCAAEPRTRRHRAAPSVRSPCVASQNQI
jgi:hypothetical protein